MAWLDVHIVKVGDFIEVCNLKTGQVTATTSMVYYVESDAVFTRDQALLATFGGVTIPVLTECYSVTRIYCRCAKRTVSWLSPTQAHVTCDYEDPTNGGDLTSLLALRARISSSGENFAECYRKDFNIDTAHPDGHQVVNTALEMFDNPPQRQAGVRVYTIKKYVNATTKTAIEDAWNSNNDASITIQGRSYAADEGWIADCQFSTVDTDETVWDATIIVKCKKGGWKDIGLNGGFRDIDGNCIKMEIDPKTYELLPVSKPWPLDSTGHAKGTPVWVDTSDHSKGATSISGDLTFDELWFWPYSRASWSGVPLS